MRVQQAQQVHERFKDALVDAMRQFEDELPAPEMLAIVAVVLGMMIAVQDQRVYTKERIMEMVVANIEAGNRQVVGKLSKAAGSA